MHRMYNLAQWAMLDQDKLIEFKGEGQRLITLDIVAAQHAVLTLVTDFGLRLLWSGQGPEKIEFYATGDVHIVVETKGLFTWFTNDGDTHHRVSEAITFTKLHSRRPQSPDLQWVMEQAERRALLRMNAILVERDRVDAARARVQQEREREDGNADTGGNDGQSNAEQSASEETGAD